MLALRGVLYHDVCKRSAIACHAVFPQSAIPPIYRKANTPAMGWGSWQISHNLPPNRSGWDRTATERRGQGNGIAAPFHVVLEDFRGCGRTPLDSQMVPVEGTGTKRAEKPCKAWLSAKVYRYRKTIPQTIPGEYQTHCESFNGNRTELSVGLSVAFRAR